MNAIGDKVCIMYIEKEKSNEAYKKRKIFSNSIKANQIASSLNFNTFQLRLARANKLLHQ
jgi:hypothetical protein